MNARKLLGAALAVAGCAALAGSASVGAASVKPAATKLTIQVGPDGLSGQVSSPAMQRCAANRRVEVFQQLGGKRDPRTDKRIAGTRASGKRGGYRWSAATAGSGRFYAATAKKPGCEADLSRTLGSPVSIAPPPPDRDDYPPCGPYVGEGTSYICKFEEMHLDLDQDAPFKACSFLLSGSCEGRGKSGLFPWGRAAQGGNPKVKLSWNWVGGIGKVLFVAYREDQGNEGTAHLSGTMPSSKDNAFTVTEGFAQNDRGRGQGDHFYTPNLPGQASGQPGGPLNLDFKPDTGLSFGAQVYISGYLYLRR